MTTRLELFASFVPKMIVQRLSEDATPPTSATSKSFPAVAFFADVAGFTKLTERIGLEGPVGVEKLTDLLNDYFGRVIDLVDSHGGDVIKFAGDAIIAVWKAELIPDGLRQATLRAAHCGLEIQRTLDNFAIEDTHLSQRIAISCGDLRWLEVGGVFARWEWLVTGRPVEQMADQHAKVGRVSLSAEAWSLIGQNCIGEVLANGQAILNSITHPVAPHKESSPSLSSAMEPGLRAFIPGAILSRMSAGQSDWLGELRTVSILFVNLRALNHQTSLELIQSAMKTLQGATYQHEGSINKLSIDDKGTTLVAAFGLPPLTHEDDPARAVQTALDMRERLRQLSLDASIGIGTGHVFCGPVGNQKRREYTVMGDRVNLTARLMQAARGDILCDQATFQRAAERCEFESLPSIHVKGKELALEVFRPLRRSSRGTTVASPLVNRCEELAAFRDALATLRKDPQNAVMTVFGAADIGKSRLLEEFARIARTAGLQVFSGGGDALEQTASYSAWRSVLSQIFQFERVPDDPQSRRDAVHAYLAADSSLLSRVSLLNPVLPLDFPESDEVKQMEGKVRAANTQEFLVTLLEQATAERETVLLMDDAQWFDSGSWAVTGLVARRVPNLLFIVAMRPLGDPTPVEYRQLIGRPDVRELQLAPLGQEEINHLLCEDLGVRDLPEIVASFINERVEGQPFFAQQLVYALRDANLIRCQEGRCELNCEADELDRLDFPDALTGVITRRLDRLAPQQQMTAKSASVIGRTFPLQLLREIYPLEDDKSDIPEFLKGLELNQIVQSAESASSPTYRFAYGMIQQVAYNLMLFSQRRKLHHAIASIYESQPGEPPPTSFPILAYHWGLAGVVSKAQEYLERAADNALRIGSYREAKVFLEQLISSLEPAQSKTPDLHRSVIERKLGQALLGMGELLVSRGHFYLALELTGHPAPVGQISTVFSIVVQAVLQLCHRFRRGKLHEQTADPVLFEQIRNYEHLAEVHYFGNDTLHFLRSVLRSLNLAEDANAHAELARAYANMGVTVGMVKLHSMAESYLRRAQETAASVSHLPTQSWVYMATGIYCNGVGLWKRSREALEKSLAISKKLGDERQVCVLLTICGATYYYQGDFDGAVERWSEVLTLGRRRNGALQEAWGYGGLAMNYLRLGRLPLAIENAEAATELFLSNADTVSEIATNGIRAVAYLREGESQRAGEVAQQVLRQLRELRHPNSYYLFEAYSAVAEVFLEQWQEGDPSIRSRRGWNNLRNVRMAMKLMRAYASVFPIGRARYFVWRGRAYWLRGRRQKAVRTWRKSLEQSQRLGMRYEHALGHLELGRCSIVSTGDRLAHLSQAVEILADCNAESDLNRAKSCFEHLASSGKG